MADMKDEIFEGGEASEEFDAPEIYTLTDEDDNELNFALLGTLEHEGAVYKALVPVDEDGNVLYNDHAKGVLEWKKICKPNKSKKK